jgi:ABC-2 type transport system permease protein
MLTIYIREIRGFFSSLTGYVVMVVFLLLTSLFMWVFSGNMNVLENGYASLDTLFSLAPWVFLFLVPAISMRMFAEEKRSGTLELLFTRPVREIEIVTAKFAAAWTLVILSILPTLLFYISVYRLGSPPGNIDIGGTWGSYIGLIFLGGIYAAIGVFSSSLTENQIVAFILAVLFSFLFYLGFSFISSVASSGVLVNTIEKFGIDYHYQSVSRGVIDSRDIIYFLSIITLFLFLTKASLQSRKW